jgi:hypothetical protein
MMIPSWLAGWLAGWMDGWMDEAIAAHCKFSHEQHHQLLLLFLQICLITARHWHTRLDRDHGRRWPAAVPWHYRDGVIARSQTKDSLPIWKSIH